MAKIERKFLAHFINTAKPGEEAVYERLGKDLEELSAQLSAQVESKKNILGENSVVISGYEKQVEVEPFYAESDSALFARLQDIIDNSRILDEVKTDVVEVKLWEAAEGTVYPAVRETAYLEVKSYGGDTTGYQIPFALHYTGQKDSGSFDVVSKVFTPA